jgi:hypothetical protein
MKMDCMFNILTVEKYERPYRSDWTPFEWQISWHSIGLPFSAMRTRAVVCCSYVTYRRVGQKRYPICLSTQSWQENRFRFYIANSLIRTQPHK